MRCKFCDFDDLAPSLYLQGIFQKKGVRNRRVLLDKQTGDHICTVCMTEVGVKLILKNLKETDELEVDP